MDDDSGAVSSIDTSSSSACSAPAPAPASTATAAPDPSTSTAAPDDSVPTNTTDSTHISADARQPAQGNDSSSLLKGIGDWKSNCAAASSAKPTGITGGPASVQPGGGQLKASPEAAKPTASIPNSGTARLSGYTTANTKMEGGALDRQKNPIRTYDDYLKNPSGGPVTVAGDPRVPYGTRGNIEINGQQVPVSFNDTGGHFWGSRDRSGHYGGTLDANGIPNAVDIPRASDAKANQDIVNTRAPITIDTSNGVDPRTWLAIPMPKHP